MTIEPQTNPSGTGLSLSNVVRRVQQISAENERLVRQLADGEFRFRRLAKAVWQVQEEERRSIALELHDGLGQILTALINHMEHAPDEIPGNGDEHAVELAKSALAEARRLSRALRPSVLDDLGLGAALRWLARTTGESTGLDIRLEWPRDEISLDVETETLVFRIVQEALTNAVRHAQASRVRITVEKLRSGIRVTVADNGRGFDNDAMAAAGEQGFGIRGMRDRAELFGGQIRIRSGAAEGTSISLVLPEAGK